MRGSKLPRRVDADIVRYVFFLWWASQSEDIEGQKLELINSLTLLLL
jgi:hypothetical protein